MNPDPECRDCGGMGEIAILVQGRERDRDGAPWGWERCGCTYPIDPATGEDIES